MPPSRLATLLVLCALLAACAAPTPRPAPADAPLRIAADSAALAATASSAERRRVVAEALRAAGLTPLAGAAYEAGAAAPVVGGFIPGRHPAARSTLVVLAQPLDGDAVAATLEAARQIVAASREGAAPARSVLVAFWSPSRSPDSGAADVRRLPLWPAERVRQVATLDALGRLRADAPGDAAPCGHAARCARTLTACFLTAASVEPAP